MSVPDAKIIHLEGKSFSCNLDRLKRHLEARSLFYDKTRSLFHKRVANGIYYVSAVARLMVFGVLNMIKPTQQYQYWKFVVKNI